MTLKYCRPDGQLIVRPLHAMEDGCDVEEIIEGAVAFQLEGNPSEVELEVYGVNRPWESSFALRPDGVGVGLFWNTEVA
jgi:hypothetical protein